MSFLFSRQALKEAVATRVHIHANPETVWNRILFYEEVPGRPPFLLRALLPAPVRTEGGKTDVGATVRCIYSTGEVVKCITAVDRPHRIEFEVVEQRLGIERCARTLGGSYRISPCGDGVDVELVTKYRAFLGPRRLWRFLESLLVSSLHGHILSGIRNAVPTPVSQPSACSAVAKSFTPQCVPSGGLACTISRSRSHP